jgi:site-specific recombinase XerD
MPWHAWTAQRRWLVRAVKKAGIESLGWHAFRQYSTLLNEYGTDAKVQQELLRHADIRTTMNIYTTDVSERLRKTNRNRDTVLGFSHVGVDLQGGDA